MSTKPKPPAKQKGKPPANDRNPVISDPVSIVEALTPEALRKLSTEDFLDRLRMLGTVFRIVEGQRVLAHWHTGQALAYLKDSGKHGGFIPALQELGIARQRAVEAMAFFRLYPDPSALEGFKTLTEALDAGKKAQRQRQEEKMTRPVPAGFMVIAESQAKGTYHAAELRPYPNPKQGYHWEPLCIYGQQNGEAREGTEEEVTCKECLHLLSEGRKAGDRSKPDGSKIGYVWVVIEGPGGTYRADWEPITEVTDKNVVTPYGRYPTSEPVYRSRKEAVEGFKAELQARLDEDQKELQRLKAEAKQLETKLANLDGLLAEAEAVEP